MQAIEQMSHELLARYDGATLVNDLRRELSQQRIHTARLIALISEVDARGFYREHAYPSMFDYAVHALHMSEGEAYPRIYVGRLARKFPCVLEMLALGQVHLSGLRSVGPVLTEENHREVLTAIRFMSKREVEHFLAMRSPKPDARSLLRKLPEPAAAAAASTSPDTSMPGLFELSNSKAKPPSTDSSARPSTPAEAHFPVEAPAQSGAAGPAALLAPAAPQSAAPQRAAPVDLQQTAQGTPATDVPCTAAADVHTALPRAVAEPNSPVLKRPVQRSDVSPIGGNRYKVQFTADQRQHDKLQQARHLLRHQIPDGDLAAICERALDLLIAQQMKTRFATPATGRTKKSAGNAGAARTDTRSTSEPGAVTATAPTANRAQGDKPGATRMAQHDPAQSGKREPPPTLPTVGAKAGERAKPSRHIPHEVRRQVLMRDGMRCTFVSTDGKRCDERGALEFHHAHAHARGGPATVENIWLRCRPHNVLAAEQDYGPQFMRQRVDDSRRSVRDLHIQGQVLGEGNRTPGLSL